MRALCTFVSLALLLCNSIDGHAAPLPAEAWIYASRLDLTCPDPATCFTVEGKDIRWYRKNKSDPFGKAHLAAISDSRDKVPATFPPEEVSLLSDSKNDRSLFVAGQHLWIAYVYPIANDAATCGDSNVAFTYEEKARPTALMAGVNHVLGALAPAPPPKAAAKAPALLPKPNVCLVFQRKVLQEQRAVVKITYTGPTTAKEAGQSSHTLITGPIEHTFLSGDVITKKLSEVKFDSTTGTFSEKSKPETVYIGLNYQLGDVYAPTPALSIDRIVAKAMISTAKKPLNSVGIGIGYQLGDFLFPTGGTSSGAIQLYGGHYWTKGDDGVRKREWRLGLSFNIDTLVAWIKPSN